MVRALSPRALAVGVVLSTSCLDLDLIAPERIEPSALLNVFQSADSILHLDLDISFHPGTDNTGRAIPIPDKTLRIDDLSIPPSSSVNGTERYEGPVLLPAGTLANTHVLITLPEAPAVDLAPLIVAVPIIKRASDAEFRLVRGSDLTVVLDGDLSLAPPHRTIWSVRLRSSCETGVQFSDLEVRGVPPQRITIPSSMIPAGTETEFMICFRVQWQTPLLDAPYPAVLGLASNLAWHVSVHDPFAPDRFLDPSR